MAKHKKERKAKATAARRHPKNETATVIALPNESADLLQAATAPADALSEENPAAAGTTSDQAASDATINTQSADEPPVVVSYDLDGTTEIEPDPADDNEVPVVKKTNEELALESAAQQAIEDDPFEVKFSEFCLYLRDNTVKVFKTAHDWVVNKWIAGGDFIGRKIDAFYVWCNKQNEELAVKWTQWFPKPITVDNLNDAIKDAFIELAQGIAPSYKELSDAHIRMSKRMELLEKAVLGDAPRTVSADKLDDYTAAIRKGENTKAAAMYATLTGSTLKAAREAVSADLVN